MIYIDYLNQEGTDRIVTSYSLYLFGAPRIECDRIQVKMDTRKAIALLAYLAIDPQMHTRDRLAAFLWPDLDQTRARAALRRTLSTLNKALAGHGLDITRETVQLVEDETLWVDVIQFRQQLEEVNSNSHSPVETCTACLSTRAVVRVDPENQGLICRNL